MYKRVVGSKAGVEGRHALLGIAKGEAPLLGLRGKAPIAEGKTK